MWDIFLSARALKGVRGAPFKRTTTAQRERAFALLSFESKRGIVVVVVLISRQVSSFTNISFFSHTQTKKNNRRRIQKTITRSEAIAQQPKENQTMSAMSNTKSVAAIILGGGAGSRLYPLTKTRSKPAVPIGGAYRLIDVPMSNCINSGINKVYILTQFNSASLNRHLAKTYNFGNGIVNGGSGFVEVLAATQTPTSTEWFQGTADAVRQYSWLYTDVKNKDVEDIVILSGDHLYRMNYMDFVNHHRRTNADITIAVLPLDDKRASDFGLMKCDENLRIFEFSEKPKGDALKAMQVDTTLLGLSAAEAKQKPYIASMGIYVFKKSSLDEFLNKKYADNHDFGGEIIPFAARDGYNVQAYLFNDYWEDIGTIKSFFEANLNLAADEPDFEFYDADSPIYTSPRYLPPAKIQNCEVKNAIISHGCSLSDCKVNDAIIGIRSNIGKGANIDHAMIIGADLYESEEHRAALLGAGEIPIGIGEGSVIKNAIIDKNARVGKNCTITNVNNVDFDDNEAAHPNYFIRDGVVVVLQGATIPDGTTI